MLGFKKILLATDFSESSLAALTHAEALTRRCDGELHVVHVQSQSWTVSGVGGWPLEMEMTTQQKQALESKLGGHVQELKVPTVSELVWAESVPKAIKAYIDEHSIDLLVLGTHAQSELERFFIGSVAIELVRSTAIPSLVVGAQQALSSDGFRHILVGVDFSAASLAALRAATEFADGCNTRITAVHAFDPTTLSPYYVYNSEADDRAWAEQEFTKTLARLNLDVEIETMVVMGRPHDEIIQQVANLSADLLVVGSHGRGMLERWLMGSVSERTLRAAPCPVLVHRAVEGIE